MRETRRQFIVGTVVSTKMDKTVVVQVETLKQHPQYKKFIRTRKNFKAHDEKNECELGDFVRCMETRPISKDKRWRITEIIRRHYTSEAEVLDPEEMVMKKQKKQQEKAAARAEARTAAAAAEKAELAAAAAEAAEEAETEEHEPEEAVAAEEEKESE